MDCASKFPTVIPSSFPTETPPFDIEIYARKMSAIEALSDMPPCLVPIHERRLHQRPRALAVLLEALLTPPQS
jgi:hypothetical protein